MIALNGRIVAQGSQFSLNDVEVVTATIDIEDVRAHRAKSSRSMQAASAERYQRVEVPFTLSAGKFEEVKDWDTIESKPETVEVRYHTPEEEIALANCPFLPFTLLALIYFKDWVRPAGSGII